MYALMNQDTPLLEFDMIEQIGDYACIETKRFSDKLPFGFTDINTWVNERNYAKHKEHLQKWLKEWQLNHVKGFVEITRGLSLNDTFWIKNVDSDLTWSDVNLYHNDFSDVVAHTAFETGLHGLRLSSPSPEFTSEGSFAKCWIKKPDRVQLIKKSSSGFANAGLESYSEYYASFYAAEICRSAVQYDLIDYKGSICSVCDMFTSEEDGFVPIYKLLNPAKQYNISAILEICSSMGFEDDFRRMIILDSVIFNHDRHLGNFGFIYDNKTMEIKRFAPVFDHNMSLLCRAMESDLVQPQEYIAMFCHKLGGEFIDVAEQLMTKEIAESLESLLNQPFPRHPEYNLPEHRLEILEKAVQHQIKMSMGKTKKVQVGRSR